MSQFAFGVHFLTYGATWPDVEQAVVAIDRLGYDGLYMHDHLYATQGDWFQPFFEAWTTVAAWAKLTTRVRLGHLTGANAFRNPGVVAKAVATLDHVSNGRAVLGMGAAWDEDELRAHGLPVGRGIGERLDWLDDALTVMRGILAGESVSHAAGPYQFAEARHAPGPIQPRVPVLMGSAGEKKGLRVVARHADYWQTWVGLEDPGVLERLGRVLATHCADVGRDPAEIHHWPGIKLVIRDTREAAQEAWDGLAKVHGWSAETRSYLQPMTWLGTPSEVAAGLRRLADLGCAGVIFTAMYPYDTETFERLIGEAGPMAGLA